MLISSNILYIYAFKQHSLVYLLTSRFMFGLGGSKVVHRKYIANFIKKEFWSKYYSRLVFFSFVGMSFGPLIYLLMIYLTMSFESLPISFLLPGYLGVILFTLFFIFFLISFRKYHLIKR